MDARKTTKLSGQTIVNLLHQPMKEKTKIWLGAIAVLDGGYVTPGRTGTGLVAIGIAEETIDNTTGADGAIFAPIRQGTFLFYNSGGTDAITQADVGKDAFIVDDQTVAKTDDTGKRSRAGRIVQIEPTGMVWVQLGIGF
ncbi:MAG: hypothetical protein HYV09_03440 [Deltaproteobacteria bacterium]|nr:hypothetical protein [Deltaproteobacteria bacterium]